ncbi:MAG: GNAT family N-acetyltransferase [Bacteroidales bacterium]|nr:GNAT family N-acetyltransferase [Bacteroidales bacterium]
MIIRSAVAEDIEFLVEAIIQADMSGSGRSSYGRIFGISDEVLRKCLTSMLLEGLDGFEISLGSFRVCEKEGKPVAAVSGWVEALNGVSSGVIKMSAFNFLLPRGTLVSSRENLKVASEISLEREASTLQIESVYTHPEFRGLGIAGKLIDFIISEEKFLHPALEKVQVQLMKENHSALNAYLKLGFQVSHEITSGNVYICEILPGRTKVLMEKRLSND